MWLPLFLIYPILLALSLLALPFLLIAALCLWHFGYGRLTLMALPGIWNVIWKARGLELNIGEKNREYLIKFV